MTRVRTLIVDDSATMRGLLALMLGQDPGIEVVGQAADAVEARALIKALDPDVVTLDIEMPGMDGIAFLEKIMALRPTPVVIVSSLTHHAATAAVRALEAGAFDVVAKPRRIDTAAAQRLAEIVLLAARSQVRRVVARPPAADPAALIAIGASTGGVEALIEVIGRFPATCPPTVIVQHMPALYTASFADRLDRLSAPRVAEARSGSPLQPGHVYLAPGGNRHLEVIGTAAPRLRLYEGPPVNGHRPSVDILFQSVARLGRPAVGVLLTGMGHDGAQGLATMRAAGARTIGQDEASSVVYGMPAAAHAAGGVEEQLPLAQIGARALALAA